MSDLVLLGSGYTQIDMSEEARKRAIESAKWRAASPHEWEWTPEQQADMALYVLWACQRLSMIEKIAEGNPIRRAHE